MNTKRISQSNSNQLRHGRRVARADCITREEAFALEHNSFASYWGLDDRLCKRFLNLATDPREFEGLKLLFPFVRELSMLRAPCSGKYLASAIKLAFLAGHDLGRVHPEVVEDVLPGAELREALRRLGVIRQCSGEERLSYSGLRDACRRIVTSQWPDVPDRDAERVLIDAAVKSLRAGFAAGSVAQTDPVYCEFVCDIPPRTRDGLKDVIGRVLVAAPLSAFGKPVLSQLEHPVLRLARELYPAQPTEQNAVLDFLREELRRLGVKSEDECPATDLELVNWIADGLACGRRVLAEQPRIVRRIFRECGESRLFGAVKVVEDVVAAAGGTEPVRLFGRLKQWQKETYGWAEPEFYGEQLAQVAYFADFAVWIPWIIENSERARLEARPKRRGLKGLGTNGTAEQLLLL